MINEKRHQNKHNLIELGLATKTSSPRVRRVKNKLKSPKNTSARRKILSNSVKKLTRASCKEVIICPHDNNLFSTSYNEEADTRYLKKNKDLFGIKFEQCDRKSCQKLT